MSSGKNNKALLGSGLLLALTSSLCCIVPILAIISGTGSAVTALSWAAPLRPYLLVTTILVLGLAFYQAYRPQPKDECGCEQKKSLFQSKSFLWLVAGVSVLLSAFPYYAKFIQPPPIGQQTIIKDSYNIQQTVLHIEGMSCEACEGHVNSALQKRRGVLQVNTSYAKSIATIKFDTTQISQQQLAATIEKETGYKVLP